MRKVAVSVLVVAFGSSYAFGGLIDFSPVKHSNVLVGTPSVKFSLIIGTLAFPGVPPNPPSTSFNAFDVVFGTNDVIGGFTPDITGWVFDPGLIFAFSTIDLIGPGKYLDDIKIGGFVVVPATITTGQVLGSLTVDTSLLPIGTYSIVVDSALDSGQSKYTLGLDVDLITTSVGQINIVPEPATLSLLGLGVLGLVLRRKKTA